MFAQSRGCRWHGPLLAVGLVFALGSLAARPGHTADANWPQWRGPLMTGVSPTADPPLTWSETSHIKWKVKIPGHGLSTPLVWGDRIFIQTAILVAKADAAKTDAAKADAGEKTSATGKTDAAAAKQDGPQPDGRRGGGRAAGQRRGRGFGRGMRSQPPTQKYRFVIMCLDRRTGKTVWQQVAREEVPQEGLQFNNTYASNSPVTDGRCVVAFFGSRGLHCYDMQGKLKWEKDLGRMKTKNAFGEGSSPALAGNKVIVNWDQEGPGFIAAFDKETGKELWRTARDEKTSWSTPIVIEHSGKPEVITAATHRVRGYDSATGKLLWECGGLTANAIPTPVAGNGLIYATTGFRGHIMLAIKPGGSGDVTGTDTVAWTLTKGTPYVPSPLLYDDRLYFFSGNTSVLSCINAKSGAVIYDDKRIDDLQGVYASPVGAAGRVYLVGRDGTTVVIRHADKFEILATNRLDDRFDASPALVGNELFLRGHEYLYAISEK